MKDRETIGEDRGRIRKGYGKDRPFSKHVSAFNPCVESYILGQMFWLQPRPGSPKGRCWGKPVLVKTDIGPEVSREGGSRKHSLVLMIFSHLRAGSPQGRYFGKTVLAKTGIGT